MNPEQEAEQKQIEELCDRAVAQIGELVDSVQIFVTKRSDDGSGETAAYVTGRGNWYARFGQVSEWLIGHRQRVKNHVTFADEDDDEGDE